MVGPAAEHYRYPSATRYRLVLTIGDYHRWNDGSREYGYTSADGTRHTRPGHLPDRAAARRDYPRLAAIAARFQITVITVRGACVCVCVCGRGGGVV